MFSRLFEYSSLQPCGWQHTRLPCPSLSPITCSDSCPLGWWCHSTISSSVATFSSCPQSFSASGSLPVSQLFASGGQRIGASAPASVLPVNIQGWFPLGLTGLISLLCKGLSWTARLSPVQHLNYQHLKNTHPKLNSEELCVWYTSSCCFFCWSCNATYPMKEDSFTICKRAWVTRLKIQNHNAVICWSEGQDWEN